RSAASPGTSAIPRSPTTALACAPSARRPARSHEAPDALQSDQHQAERPAGQWHRGHRLEPRRHELLAQRDTAMMKTKLRTIGTGLKLALLAAASVLALELVYAHAVLDAPVRLEASIVALYAAVFALVGLAAGVAAAVFRRPAAVAP